MRDIDKIQTARSKPMRVLVLGLSRTGTSSLCLALTKFNYKTFHMNECLAKPTHFFPLWTEAIRAKYDTTNDTLPYGAIEFDKLLSDYDAVSDVPAVLFAPELLAAYPDAKVILTTRDPEKWVDSMRSSIWLAHSWWTFDLLKPFHALIRGWRELDTLDWDAFINSSPDKPAVHPVRRDYQSSAYRELAIQRFHEHNAYIRHVVPEGKLLEFRAQDGWEPLCQFLGEEVPEEAYPRAWDKDEVAKQAAMIWWVGLGSAVLQIGAPIGVAVGAGWVARRFGWW